MTEIHTREAREEDTEEIRAIFQDTYGEAYPFQDIYDTSWLKRAIFGDHMLMVVAEDADSGSILGTGSVDLDIGAHSDLIGEFSRLVVHADARGQGVGRAIMQYRIELVQERLHMGLANNRTTHPYSQKISEKFGFAPVGFLPLKHRIGDRESVAVFARHFGLALELRKNRPRVAPLVAPIAQVAMSNLGMDPDVVVDESTAAYSSDADFELSEFEAEGMPDLLRIERGRVREREVFGPIRLHYGFFQLAAREANYLVARRPGSPREAISAALGFLHDELEGTIRVFELIAASDEAIRHLFEQLLGRARDLGVEYIEVDVNAQAPRLQRTLLELDFLPAAYVPAMVFHEVERLDVVKMVHLLDAASPDRPELIDTMDPVFDAVMKGFRTHAVLPRLAASMKELLIFTGLTDDQALRVAGAMSVRDYRVGEELFAWDESAEELFVLIEGDVEVVLPTGLRVGKVGRGEVVGENAMLARTPHSASVQAVRAVTAGVLTREGLNELTERRPDIAVVLYRNLAKGLGEKLRQADTELDGQP